MARLIAVVLAVGLACGCQTYRGSKTVAYTGGAVMLGSLVIGGSAIGRDSGSDRDATEAMVGFLVIGGIIALCGLAGMAVYDSDQNPMYGSAPPPMMGSPPPMMAPPMQPQPPPPVDPQGSDLERKRRAAWDLTQQARTAAHANDCPRVAYLAQRVIELDRGTFDTVFSTDPYIVKCAPKPPQDPARRIPIPPLNPTPPPDPPPPAP
jgi:hypothetical protein